MGIQGGGLGPGMRRYTLGGMGYYVYICGMKRLLHKYRNWRYRRLFRRLVFVYARNEQVGGRAVCYAKDAFYEIMGFYYSDVRDVK